MIVMEYICHPTHILVPTDAHSFEFTSIEILTLALRVEPEPRPGKWVPGLLEYWYATSRRHLT